MKKLILFFFILCTAISCQHSPKGATSATASPQNLEKVTCTLNSDTRQIEILPYQKSGCHVNYTKYKTAKSIAKAQSEKSYCREVSQKIVTNLTNSGFICE